MLLLLFLVTLPIIFFFTHFFQKFKNSSAKQTLNPPGPPGLPFIGNLHQIPSDGILHKFLYKLSNKYGEIMYMKLGSVPIVVISSPKLAKHVLKTHDHVFCSRSKSLGQQKLSYNNLDIAFSPYNDYWREVRKISTVHLFSSKKVQSFGPIREDEISRLVAKISGFAHTSREANLKEMLTSFTSTLICRVAFGKRYEEEGYERQRFDGLLSEAQALLISFFVSDYIPAFGWVDKLSGMMSRLEKNFEGLDDFYQEFINEHLDPNRRKTIDDDDNILDVLIKLKEQELCPVDLDWDNIKALLMDIFIGGTDTSAATIIWTMTALMKAPNVMKKVQAEIRDLIGNKGKIDEDDLQKLPYLKAVINETFRLYTPNPILGRRTMERCTLEGYEIQPDTVVYVNAWAIARDPDYWKNPDAFLPERFLNGNIKVKGQDFGLIPFGSGRRMCPGMYMGLSTVGLTVANMLYYFDWEMPPGMKPQDIDADVLPGITSHKKNALCLVPKKYI